MKPGKRKVFEKGHKRLGGRTKGTPNKATYDLKQMIDRMVPEKELERRWLKKLNSQDEHISMKALELLLHYRFGKPVQPIVGEEFAAPIKIDISAIPTRHVRA